MWPCVGFLEPSLEFWMGNWSHETVQIKQKWSQFCALPYKRSDEDNKHVFCFETYIQTTDSVQPVVIKWNTDILLWKLCELSFSFHRCYVDFTRHLCFNIATLAKKQKTFENSYQRRRGIYGSPYIAQTSLFLQWGIGFEWLFSHIKQDWGSQWTCFIRSSDSRVWTDS